MRDYLNLPLRLTVICLAAAVLLGATYTATANTIDQREEETATSARRQTIPDAESFEKMKAEGLAADYPEISGVYAAKKGGEIIGFAVELTAKGYGGDISLSVGVLNDGGISGVRINTHTETAGLGAKCAKPEFYTQYDGTCAPLEVKKEIIPISGATVTSRGVTDGVNMAAQAVEKYAAKLTAVVE